MAVTRLLHFIPDSRICRNQKSHQQLKCSITRDKLRLSTDHKSTLTSDHDLLERSLSDCIKRPIRSIRYSHSALKCRCSILPDSITRIPYSITKIPFVKRAIVAIRGPTTPLPSSPSIANLVIAVAVLVFILWGLQPLVRTGRNMFLHKDDTTWRRSNTHYLLTSYLQPFLLWVGVMLVCRALDPVVMPTKVSRLIKERVITFIRSLSTVVALAYCVSCAVQRAHKVFVETNEHPDAGSMGFQLAGKAVYTSVWIAAVSLFMELLGFSAKKWLTAGGLGTVLLTLAGREIFTNFLSSVIIQATRPFVLNEWIQTKIEGYEVSGTVEDVGWWSPTLIRGEDREAVYIPNHKFTVNIVRNLSQKTHWRIRASLAISHLDVNKINTIVADMRKVLAKNPQVEQQKLHRRVFLDTINPENQALTILISCFVETTHHEEYLCVKEAILLDLLRVITHHGARLATPIRTIQKHHSDPEMNSPFSESGFSRDHVPPNRPFFLIEPPSYKINGEGFARARIARGGGQDRLAAGQQSKSDSTEDGKIKETSASQSETGETLESCTTSPSQGTPAPGPQPTTDSKRKEKSASQSTTGETPKSGIAALDQDLKGISTSKSKPGEPSKSGTMAPDQDSQASSKQSKLKETSATQSRTAEMPKSDEDGSSSRLQSSISDSKANAKLKVTSTSTSTSTSQSKTGEASKSGIKAKASSADAQKSNEDSKFKQPDVKASDTSSNSDKKSSSGDSQQQSVKMESQVSSSEDGVRKSNRASSAISQPTQTEKPSPAKPRPTVEENIVLEVALDGSKRTLPVDEYRPATSATPIEGKEVATNLNSNENGDGALTINKVDKDN